MKLSVVIPMYNESANALGCFERLSKYLENNFENYEVIFVNDGSRDGTEKIIEPLCSEKIKLVSYEQNRGKGFAVKSGITAASGDIVMYTDCDLAYGVDVIKSAYSEFVRTMPDILAGSRVLGDGGYGEYSAVRKIASRAFLHLVRLISGLKVSDTQCGFKLIRGDKAKKLFDEITSFGFAFDFEILFLAKKYGMTTVEFPVKIVNHVEAVSKVNIVKDSFRMLREVIRIKKSIK